MNRQLQKLSSSLCIQKGHYSASPLAGRTFLPGAEAITFPKFVPKAHHDFPFIFKAKSVQKKDLVKFGSNFRPFLDELLKRHGVVLIRGAEIDNATSFSDFAFSLDYRMMKNITGLGERRREVAKCVYTVRTDPPQLNIEPHSELSHLKNFPHLFFIHCERPVKADGGGEYILVNTRHMQRELDHDVFEKFKSLGVRYHRQLPYSGTDEKPSWRDVMDSSKRDVVEARLKSNGFTFHWDEDDGLHYWIDLPAVSKHHTTGEQLWFNQVHAKHWTFHSNHPNYFLQNLPPSQFPTNTLYGDGSPIAVDVIQHIREVLWRNAQGVRLQRGDLLIMDNMLIQNGRLAYRGDRIYSVAMARYPNPDNQTTTDGATDAD